jgi:FkbM family methyltransferase
VAQHDGNRLAHDQGNYVAQHPRNRVAQGLRNSTPLKYNCNIIEETKSFNNIKNLEVIEAAVGDGSVDQLKFYISENSKAESSLAYKVSENYNFVQVVSVDHFVTQNNLKEVSFIKIDVEGAELDVIRGATQTLKRFKPQLMIEFNSSVAKLSGYSLEEIFTFLKPLNYKAFLLKKNGTLEPADGDRLKNIYLDNVIFQ